ncbi:hypothetical protein CPB84DRAFT_1957528 [Gymnopilus junonius]|uniref:Uncharacterized protein n=1 Tax=Gymnopilus junonius TaxID=109634 RepID=A0A9P5P3U0_GYMJU|nr:hypothetical protein CPB84DRAFT_1957528 [Gymnopilus junonius]
MSIFREEWPCHKPRLGRERDWHCLHYINRVDDITDWHAFKFSYSALCFLSCTMSPSDHVSLHSFFTSSEHTAVSDPTFSPDDERPPRYLDDSVVLPHEKTLPDLPSKEKQRSLEAYDRYAAEQSGSPSTSIHPLTTATQLSRALGPDNTPHFTEIDTIPCAGVRIPQGSLTGLLAWRLVVRKLAPTKGKRTWWNNKAMSVSESRRKSYAVPPPSSPGSQQTSALVSTLSLPLTHAKTLSSTSGPDPALDLGHPYSAVLSALPPSEGSLAKAPSADGVVTNFILDTSLPYSIISPDTLMALGYPPNRIPPISRSNPHVPDWEEDQDNVITLSVQGITTRLRIARLGEASRLGVQFLQDAGVSLFFPVDGEGVGPVLYLESARLMKGVPRTISSLPNGARGTGMGKLTLPQRVRALLGLT